MAELEHPQALPLIQRRIAEVMGTRITPAITLRFDPSLEHAQHLEEIFDRLRKERGEPIAEEGEVAAAAADAGADADEDEDEIELDEEIPPEDLPRDEDFEEEPE